MRIFITGLAGMIGFHTAMSLKKDGHEVFGIDSFNDFYDVNLKRERQRILKENGIECEQLNINLFRYLFASDNLSNEPPEFDVFLHLAAYCNPRHSLEYPELYIQNNIIGTQRVIDYLSNYQIPVVYASSSCVAHGQSLPWNETDNPGYQNSPYGWSKRVNECQFKSSKISRSIGLRFFTVYGPYGRPDMALFKFTKNILDKKPITVYNYGNMKRDFTYVDDIIFGIKLILNKILSDEGQNYHEIFNIGNGTQVNLMDFIREIENKLGIKAIMDLAPPHPGDVPETWSDITKIKELGYNPKTSVKEGIGKFVDWYKHYYKVN